MAGHLRDQGRTETVKRTRTHRSRTEAKLYTEQAIRIASWNVNSIKSRLPAVTAWLETQQPDVLLLQELKGVEFPTEHFVSTGYQSVFIGQKSYNGVAILSRHPIEVLSTTLPGDEEDSHARFLEARIQGIRIVDIYLPNGNPIGTPKFEYKLRWMERLRQAMAGWVNEPTVVAGDYNVIPEDIDCYKPASWVRDALFQPETRAAWRALLGLGYVDAFRMLHPEATGQYTYWDYFRQAFETNRGIRIDHALLSPPLADRLVSVEIDRSPRGGEKPSDHTPITVELR